MPTKSEQSSSSYYVRCIHSHSTKVTLPTTRGLFMKSKAMFDTQKELTTPGISLLYNSTFKTHIHIYFLTDTLLPKENFLFIIHYGILAAMEGSYHDLEFPNPSSKLSGHAGTIHGRALHTAHFKRQLLS